ncbi:NusG domain II-containing protein [Bacillus kwashiorkori]|uniref:NusG domain II-containing protein n=1 Tax=Bacillus kwashiorkori TaxID=1522318 RepID=UPI000782E558|nr:NusG domain II-containing protein [Bacillus kwashiorkori]
MRSYYRMIKRWDIIVVTLLVILSFLPVVIFTYAQTEKSTEDAIKVAVISLNNKEIKRVTLTGHQGTEIFDVHGHGDDVNTIEIIDEKIRIKSANCSDQVCVRTGYITKPGKTIVCLPHKLIIEIQTVDGETEDLIISS